MDSDASLWSTVRDITAIKGQELAKQRDACKALQKELLDTIEAETDARTRAQILLKDAGKRVLADSEPSGRRRRPKWDEMSIKSESAVHDEILALAGLAAPNVQLFLEQSRNDASISSAYFRDVENRFRTGLQAQTIKYEYATLFSDLVTERSSDLPTSSKEDTFEAVGRREMHNQRQIWESIVFQPLELNQDRITATLEETFSSPEAQASLNELRNSMETLCLELRSADRVTAEQMRWVVDGLLTSDLLADDQSAILKQAQSSPTWLSEMADVLNLRLASIERWHWDSDAMPLEMRRQLNGKYRVFMREDITQALLIYYIGITFATRFACMLDVFYASTGWKKHTGIGRDQTAKYDYFIGNRSTDNGSIASRSQDNFKSQYFMTVLPRRIQEGAGGYGEDSLGDDARREQSRVKQSVEAKQSLLHLLVSESLVSDRLGEDMVVVQTDFRWFGPSLSHSTIAAVMKFFGVTGTWQIFFGRCLRAPMRFVQDGPDGAVRTRQRGVPMSHVLGDFFGEAALFCVDFAVNEATKGKPMYRMHDDVWMWGSPEETTAAWASLMSLSTAMGLEINKEKTGTARLTRQKERAQKALPRSLPLGPLRWGLLSVQQSGQFAIDQAKITEHIDEMRHQLGVRKSVMAWIKAYNTYMQFFALHFCHPANCLGRAHIDDCLQTLARIHAAVLPDTDGNVAAHVKHMISARFGVSNIPDGFVFFPLGVGGLELHNPFVQLQSQRLTVLEEPLDALDEAVENEELQYRRLQEEFDQHGPANRQALRSHPPRFLSRGEFAMFRREHSPEWFTAWGTLMEQGEMSPVKVSAETNAMLIKMVPEQRIASHFQPRVGNPYWMTLLELYGSEMIRVFGGLHVVEKGLLPMGMVKLFSGKVRWEA